MKPFFDMPEIKPEVNKLPKRKKKTVSCRSCQLKYSCKSPQFKTVGKGGKRILIIGPPITREQDDQQNQICGSSISFLQRKLTAVGIDLHNDCWYLSAVACYGGVAMKNSTKKEAVVTMCRSWWKPIVAELKPEKIILLGNDATIGFVGDRTENGKIGGLDKWVGFSIPDQTYQCWVYPTYDPKDVLIAMNPPKGLRVHPVIAVKFEQHLANIATHNEELKDIRGVFDDVDVLLKEDLIVNYLGNLVLHPPKLIVFDYESNCIKPEGPKSKLKCASFCIKDEETGELKSTAFVISDEFEWQHDTLQSIFSNPKTRFCAHNIKMEYGWTKRFYNVSIKNWEHDPMISAHVLDNRDGVTGLKHLTYVKLGIMGYDNSVSWYLKTSKTGEDEKSGYRINRIDDANLYNIVKYCALDSLFTYKLKELHEKELRDKRLRGAYHLTNGVNFVFVKASNRGMKVDSEYCNTQLKTMGNIISNLQKRAEATDDYKQWYKQYGNKTNLTSGAQLLYFLKNIKKFNLTKKTERGTFSTDKFVIQEFADESPLLKILLMINTKKTQADYFHSILRETVNGRMHPSFNFNLIGSYRSSASNPNVHNFPKRDPFGKKLVRNAIRPSDGRRIRGLDFSGAEVSANASITNDQNLVSYLRDGGDMHLDTGMDIYKINDVELMTKPIRQTAKGGLVFPFFYGDYYLQCAGPLWDAAHVTGTNALKLKDGTLLSTHMESVGLGDKNSFVNHLKRVEDIFWNERFYGVAEWRRNTWDEYCKNGFIRLKQGFELNAVKSRNSLLNAPGQSLGFHFLSYAAILIDDFLEKSNFKTSILSEIHDELIFDAFDDEWPEIEPFVVNAMVNEVPKHWSFINVPLGVDMDISEIDGRWGETKKEPLKWAIKAGVIKGDS